MYPRHADRAASAVGSRGDIPGIRLCVVAHLLFGPLAIRRHRLSFSRDFRGPGHRRRGAPLATAIVERQSNIVALRVLAADDSGLRSGAPCLRDSCRLADDAPLGSVLWMSETPVNPDGQ